ncbi:hypothetical protein SAMN04488570_1599 [Nocardioides scoriae]|uniref:Uncharacterized protein n=1 Tax=Nocardioides scoriae TaxID=642780 RepID=A0A1H1R5M4_9ACTN|nr:hypothetical protein SAMN04488570_1599 [Nocardioides scoriae]
MHVTPVPRTRTRTRTRHPRRQTLRVLIATGIARLD